jgi:hypothetical protein
MFLDLHLPVGMTGIVGRLSRRFQHGTEYESHL